MTNGEGAKAFLLGRVHPAIWLSCLGYLAPVAASPLMRSGGDVHNARVFRLAFLAAAVLLLGGAFLALWRMHARKRADPTGPQPAGRLVALLNCAMGAAAFIVFLAVPAGN